MYIYPLEETLNYDYIVHQTLTVPLNHELHSASDLHGATKF